MKRRWTLGAALSLAVFAVMPASGLTASGTQTYELEMEAPNIATAPNGDMVSVLGHGEFSVHPKTVEASGTFTHTDSEGNVVGSGTWEATRLLTYQSYGCGVVVGQPIPSNFCGGKLKMRVMLAPPVGEFRGILTVFCIIGPKAPTSHDDPTEEGITLSIPGVINFNKVAGGENIYIRTS